MVVLLHGDYVKMVRLLLVQLHGVSFAMEPNRVAIM